MDIRIEAPSAGPNRSAPKLMSLVYLQHFDICLWCIWGDSEISITKNVWTWMAPYLIKWYGNIKTGGGYNIQVPALKSMRKGSAAEY